MRIIIKLKENIPAETAAKIRDLCIEAHDNSAGRVGITDISQIFFTFEGRSDDDFPCLSLGWHQLHKQPLFSEGVLSVSRPEKSI